MSKRKGVALTLSILMFVALWGGTGSSAARGETILILMPLDVGVAETGVIEARIACGGIRCEGFEVTISFDRALLRIEDVAVGPYLGDQVFLEESTIDNPAGIVRLAASAVAPPPTGADNVLFRLTVMGLKPGKVALNVDSFEVTGMSGEVMTTATQINAVSVFETGKIAFFSPPQHGWEVAFVSERDGNPEIYVINADGSNPRRLTDHEALDGGPTWSPDGSQIAFCSARDGNMEIYVMDASGGNLRRLTDNPAADMEPAWSPDGRQIVFTSDRDGIAELYVINADGSDPQRLTNNAVVDASPAWSPVSGEIVFTSRPAQSSELFLINDDGSGMQQISNLFGANGWYPAWAPDGRLMSFTSDRDNEANIYTLDWQNKTVQQLTKESIWLTSTDWSPDGGWIAFMAGYDGNADLFVMDTTGTDLFRLTDHEAEDYDPDWRPGGEAPTEPEALAPCFVSAENNREVKTHVGPGEDRGVFGFLVTDQIYPVMGQAVDEMGIVWWLLDKDQIAGGESANSLWVSSDYVAETGDCAAVARVDAPPVIPGGGPANTVPGTWGACGSCSTCGYVANECILAPDGACVWDPSTCHYEPHEPPGPEPTAIIIILPGLE
jgi:TolB protein